MSIFSGLEAFGVNTKKQQNIYDNGEAEREKELLEQKKKEEAEKAARKPTFTEEKDYLLQKDITCTVCGKKFKTFVVRNAKLRRSEPDYDLRPRFHNIDTLKYHVTSCPHCGYTALTEYFTGLTKGQIQLVRENIGRSFKSQDTLLPETYDYTTAIMRTKLALYNAVVKRGKTSERAYTCLKTYWLYRDHIQEVKEAGYSDFLEIDRLTTEMRDFAKEAYEGFQKAMAEEPLPICGMDSNTLEYLLACLGTEIKDYTHAARFLSDVITSKTTNSRLKDRALELKDKVLEEVNAAKNQV
ncbi:MAG: DUF2225 domain-containing protein [Lachnospiraceae bacterium]|nr:DUF2225 domain-containing protein [Lachnospiraceae bacterium]